MKKLFHLFIAVFLFSCNQKTAIENFNAGVECYTGKDFDCAKKYFSKAVELDDKNSQALLFLIKTETELSDYKNALLHLNTFFELDSNSFEAFSLRAKVKANFGDYKSALTDCSKSLKLKFDFLPTHLIEASIYDSLFQTENSINAYKNALHLNPKDCKLYERIGQLYNLQGKRDEAYSFLSKAGELGCIESYKQMEHLNSTATTTKSEEVLTASSAVVEVNESNSSARDAAYYQSKGYQVFSEQGIAVKCDCQLKDVSAQANGNFDLNYACQSNENSKSDMAFFQVIVNNLPDGYYNATQQEKDEFKDKFFTKFSLQNPKKVVFKRLDAIVSDFVKNGYSGRGIAFIYNNKTYAFTVITNNDLTSKFNQLTNRIEFLISSENEE